MNSASLFPAPIHRLRFGAEQPEASPAQGSTGSAEATADSFDASKQPSTPQSANPPSTTSEAKGFFKALGERISRFFKDLGKAFQHLFSSNGPKSEFDAQFKTLRRNLKQTFNEEAMDKDFKALGEKLESTDAGPEAAQVFEPLIAASKTEAGRKTWIQENLAKGLEALNETVATPENQSNVRQGVLTIPVIQAQVTRELSNAFAGLVPQSHQGSSSSLHPEV